MKQIKVNNLTVYEGPDEAAHEYAAGLVRQAGSYAVGLAAEVARGERDLIAIDGDTFVVIEDSSGPRTLSSTEASR